MRSLDTKPILTIGEGYACRLLSNSVQREIGLQFKESGAKISHNSSKILLRSTVSKQAVTLSDSRDVRERKIQTSVITSPDISKTT